MSEQNKNAQNTQPDKDEAAREHPRPSQAEGDRETIEEDLREKGNSGQQQPKR
ncbi:MAG TPA: hypothetical protein VKX25_14205 [Bryobacteraceae bacterium]|jgi:hypothetical protein|nr:hypothetical protein [Bryobacteraceae bacterium]